MKRFAAIFLIGVAFANAALLAQSKKYGVTASAEKNVDFTKFKTYSWSEGRPSADKTINAQIMAAVDKELAALGLTKVTATPDVRVSYFSMTRTDVDVKAKPDASGLRPQYQVGTLVVALLNPTTLQPLLRLRADKPIEGGADAVGTAINEVAVEMFEIYPTRKK